VERERENMQGHERGGREHAGTYVREHDGGKCRNIRGEYAGTREGKDSIKKMKREREHVGI
jgi:hypothetical protein